jgi:hypothetical protein
MLSIAKFICGKCPLRVKGRKPHSEHMFSGMPLIAAGIDPCRYLRSAPTNKQLSDEWLKTAIEYKHEWEQELARRTALGVTGPEPLPYPDAIDMKTG